MSDVLENLPGELPGAGVDPARVGRGVPIYCPFCGHPASAETMAGRAGHRRYFVTCTDIDCHQLKQVVEVEEATGLARTIADPNPDAAKAPRKPNAMAGLGKSQLNAGLCPIDGCGHPRKHAGLCSRHYQRWVCCGKPDRSAWEAVGGPSPRAWAMVSVAVAEN